MKIGILTSSRADYGYYLPLIKAMDKDPFFELNIIAFGTHLSRFHGYTISEIEKTGFKVNHKISSILLSDEPASIASAYGITSMLFAGLWESLYNDLDWVLCIGDRYEMAAAVSAGIPFNIKFAHIGGGDTTLGAIDNIYRHAITLASKIHFVQLNEFANRVHEILGKEANCIVTGSLSLDNIREITLLSKQEFHARWKIDLSMPSILVTIHPETIAYQSNLQFADTIFSALSKLSESYQLIITMPNNDTKGSVYREMYKELKRTTSSTIFMIENFGTESYFSCLKYSGLVLGNSSSGIIEAASFNKYVLNIGDRQKGRLSSGNVINVPFNPQMIINNAHKYYGQDYLGKNIYYKGNASQIIINTLKQIDC